MTILPWHQQSRRRGDDRADASVDLPPDDLIADARRGIDSQQADCCIARAAYQVTIPPSPGRRRPTELLLCAHHYRESRVSLVAAHALVSDRRGSLVAQAGRPVAAIPADGAQHTDGTSNQRCEPV